MRFVLWNTTKIDIRTYVNLAIWWCPFSFVLGLNQTIVPPVSVHGSLARAGKVRGQTPKVEAQEKKKKKTGRAKRRIQYNRRFVNVVAGFGKKKGPNSNS